MSPSQIEKALKQGKFVILGFLLYKMDKNGTLFYMDVDDREWKKSIYTFSKGALINSTWGNPRVSTIKNYKKEYL